MALDDIVAHKRAEVAARRTARPLATFRETLRGSDRSLAAALRRPHTGFVLECKRASPSQGALREALDLHAVAAAYGPYADAVSVLTDERFFGGSFDHLRTLRRQLHQPVLCKDFIVEPYQVYEARWHGADAVLLMLSVLSDDDYLACREAAHALALDVVTEVHSDLELARATRLDAAIIGINNRDLRTLRVDLDVTARLAPNAGGEAILLAESGIEHHHETRRLRSLVHGFLVGSSLMRQTDLGYATRALIFGVTKVCGLTLPEDAVTAHALGATHGGLIFAAESPRLVPLDLAARIRAAAPLRWVGVFVNAPTDTIVAIAEDLDLAAVQLHGEEPPEVVAALRERFAGHREVWKAVRVLREPPPPLVETGADRLVLDNHSDRARGGTGQRFNWELLAQYPDLDRVVLGGGVTPEAVEAAEAIGPWGLDVNSGVERAPGRKDPVKLATFLERRRGRGRAGREAP